MIRNTTNTSTAYPMDAILVTDDNIEDVREIMCAADQADEIYPGCVTQGILYEPGQQRGQLTVYSNNMRAAICIGGYSVWGEWDDDAETLTTDDGIVYDEDGESGNKAKKKQVAEA